MEAISTNGPIANLTNLEDVERVIAGTEQELRENEAQGNRLIGRLEILMTLRANLQERQAHDNGSRSLEEVFRG